MIAKPGRATRWCIVVSCMILSPLGATAGEKVTVKGWLSDEQCATARASSGNFTATNLACAKECVAKGKKIVLVDPEGKRVLMIENQEVAAKNVGDYVEITGIIDPGSRSLHADSLKFLDKNRAMCGVPEKKAAGGAHSSNHN
jgi:hypothetical protein